MGRVLKRYGLRYRPWEYEAGRCGQCKGRGVLEVPTIQPEDVLAGFVYSERPCPHCDGNPRGLGGLRSNVLHSKLFERVNVDARYGIGGDPGYCWCGKGYKEA